MSTQTATVETLTATVRILQVGNRQVTASMVKQLDMFGLEDLEVWGRVKYSVGSTPFQHLIGVTADGELGLAWACEDELSHHPLLVLGGAR